jgi:hypothetical protein
MSKSRILSSFGGPLRTVAASCSGGALAIASLVMSLTIGTPAHATEPERRHDSAAAVLDWSQIAQNSIVAVAKKFPGEAALLMGIVHSAIYDATAAVEAGLVPYVDYERASHDTSLPAGVATAAHDVPSWETPMSPSRSTVLSPIRPAPTGASTT